MRDAIVFGYHGGNSAEGALELGSAIGWRTGAQLLLTLAYPPEGFTLAEAEELLRRALRKLPYGQLAGVRPVDAGAPATGLAHTAHDEGARLVVLGTSATPTIAAQLAEAVTCPIAVAPCRQI